MIRAICNLLIVGGIVVSLLSFAGAQENQVKKSQVKPASPVRAQMFKQ